MENAFKILIGFTAFVFCLVVIGIFLLAIKIALIWLPDLTIMGVTMTSPS